MSYTHTFAPAQPPAASVITRRINGETARTCENVAVNWLAEPGEVKVTLDEEAVGAELMAIAAIVGDADYQFPESDPEYLVEEYRGNKLESRTVYADAAMTTRYSERTWEYSGNSVYRETMVDYDAGGNVRSTMTWQYTTENLPGQRCKITKLRIA